LLPLLLLLEDGRLYEDGEDDELLLDDERLFPLLL
jgi:hypothetical protein